jgi:arylsulfatase A-like enzyme
MDTQSKIAIIAAPKPEAEPGSRGSPRVGAGATTILLLAAWIGLLAGFLDLGLMVVNRLFDGDFYRLSNDFVWIIPAAVAVVVLLPGAVLALCARLRRGGLSLSLAVGLLSFVGSLDVCGRLPFAFWAALLFSGGLAVQFSRLVRRRSGTFLNLVRSTAPLLTGIVLAAMGVTLGGRAWSEHRAAAALPPPPRGARNVLLIVWDTVRTSNLSLHGYARRTTPNLEALAARGTRFDLACATSSWTLPSHASLFTGRWPHELGVDWQSPLKGSAPTIAEYLGGHGYDTAGFVANLDYCARETGLNRGFAHYEDYPLELYDTFTRYVALVRRLDVGAWACTLGKLWEIISGRSHHLIPLPRAREHVKPASAVDRAFLDWLTWQQGRHRPFFAFLNYNDAHTPYEAPDPSIPGFGIRPSSCWDRLTLLGFTSMDKARLSYHDVLMATDAYDDSIFYLDRRLRALLDELRRRGVLEDTLVIVTADHGEHLGDHLLFFHGCSLYRQLIQVPLVIVGTPRVPAGGVVAGPVSLRDLPATIVDLLALGGASPFPGRTLARFWQRAEAAPAAEPLLMEMGKPMLLTNQGREPAAKGPMVALVADGMHYIRSADGLEELYMLSSDPEERLNLAGTIAGGTILPGFRDRLMRMLRRR